MASPDACPPDQTSGRSRFRRDDRRRHASGGIYGSGARSTQEPGDAAQIGVLLVVSGRDQSGADAGVKADLREGVREGEKVVTGANFLIDAESNLRASLQAFTAPEGKSP
jgi:hypothetical protein